MSDENVELMQQAFEAGNRGDLEWLLDHSTPDVEFRTSQTFPDIEAVYPGREGFRRFWTTFREPWETLRVEVERIEPVGDDRALALYTFHGRGRDGLEVTLKFGNLITLENGLVSRNVAFGDWEEALQAARLGE